MHFSLMWGNRPGAAPSRSGDRTGRRWESEGLCGMDMGTSKEGSRQGEAKEEEEGKS